MIDRTVVPYHVSRDKDKCRALMLAVLVEFGIGAEVFHGGRCKEPENLYRQLAKVIALDHGFHYSTVADVIGCHPCTVRYYAPKTLAGRIKKDQSIIETATKACAAAQKWQETEAEATAQQQVATA